MPVKLSETPMLYQPVGPVEKLEADLERLSDPAQFDQDDPRLRMIVRDLRNKLDGRQMPEDSATDQDRLMGSLRSMATDEDEAQEMANRRHGQ